MMKSKALAIAITATSIGAWSVLPISASAQQSEASESVSETELDAFVVAYEEVVAIEQEYGAKLQQTNDDAEKQTIVDEAQAAMTQAVEEAPDIDVDRYLEILGLAQTDPDLQAQLTAKLRD